MKVAVFENEYDSVRGAFETANLLKFNETLNIEVFPSSQSTDLNKINSYDVVFVDIDLSSKSEFDGFTLIKHLKTINTDSILKKIIILTGNNKIEETLRQREIDPKSIKVIIKPTNYKEISENIHSIRR